MTRQEAWDFVFKAGWEARLRVHLGADIDREWFDNERILAVTQACVNEADEVARLLHEAAEVSA